MSGHILLTGATGLLGRYLLRELLLKGTPVAVLIRARGKQSAPRRLQQLTSSLEEELGRELPATICVEGDIAEPGFGWSSETHRWVAHNCELALHNAASLTFVGRDRDRDPWLSNTTGTANMLEICRQTGIRELHYVSTAYVCGTRLGTVFEEDIDCGQSFHNDYENSKLEAEKRVRAAGFLNRLTVYRPAVIVGDSRTGFTATYHGLYSYLHFAWLMLQMIGSDADGRTHLPVRLKGTGGERRNLVPVDWVSAVIAELLLDPSHHGRTYHLVPEQPVTAREIEEAMSSFFNYFGPTFTGSDPLAPEDFNQVEQMFYGYVSQYESYWAEEPEFNASNTLAAVPHLPCPTIDQACLHRLMEFAVHDQWGKGPRRRNVRERALERT